MGMSALLAIVIAASMFAIVFGVFYLIRNL